MDIRNFFKRQKVDNCDSSSAGNGLRMTENETVLEESGDKIGDSADQLLKVVATTAVDVNDSADIELCEITKRCEKEDQNLEFLPRGINGVVTSFNVTGSEQGVVPSFSCYQDIGRYLDLTAHISLTDNDKFKLITEPWVPSSTYNFKDDLQKGQKRAFLHKWLDQPEYMSWLVYSKEVKGALCRHCVLFRPTIRRGLQGAFIIAPFTKYKDMHSSCKNHMSSEWHKEAIERSKNFIYVMNNKSISVNEQIDSAFQNQIKKNREKLAPIVSSIIFCATHDLPLRGNKSDSGVLHDLLHFRAESGDITLREHLQSAAGNAKYTSVRTQNEIIEVCGQVLKEQLVKEINNSCAFSVLADETADIAGTEQLSLGIRFISEKTEETKVFEEFIGFVPLDQLNAESLANAIITYLLSIGVDMTKMVGQGYDGCSVMAGKLGGVAKLIQEKYPKALYLHCASHRLNLVVNDLNGVQEIRNSCGTIKEIIVFFRESTTRRKLVPKIPLFCETRWSAKHKSIRIFSENYVQIIGALEELAVIGNSNTRQRAHQLLCAATASTFIVALHIIAQYSGVLEPVTNILQGVSIDISGVRHHIRGLISLFQQHRHEANSRFQETMKSVHETASRVNVEISVPRQTTRQTYRANMKTDVPEDYYRVSLYIPYLDSLITSLQSRFSEESGVVYSLLQLHPENLKSITPSSFHKIIQNIQTFYCIDNFVNEAKCWYELWKNKLSSGSGGDTSTIQYSDIVKETKSFFPAVSTAVKIAMTLPTTTCSVERSFSTLRRVKTWLRSTMSDERLDGLCMMSLHRETISTEKDEFTEKVISTFARQSSRRLQFLFKD